MDVKALNKIYKMGYDMKNEGVTIYDIVSREQYSEYVAAGKALYEISDWQLFRELTFRVQRKIVKMLLAAVDAYLDDPINQPEI